MRWLTDFSSLVQRILTLGRELDQHRADIKELQTQVRDLTAIVRALAQESKHAQEKTEQRHENLLLEIENRLLKHEKVLPPSTKKAAKKGRRK